MLDRIFEDKLDRKLVSYIGDKVYYDGYYTGLREHQLQDFISQTDHDPMVLIEYAVDILKINRDKKLKEILK